MPKTLEQRLTDFATLVAADVKLLTGEIGSLAGLTTAQKGTIVGALNELHTLIGSSTVIDDLNASGASTYSSSKINALIASTMNQILNGAPAALDTLKELADQLTSDETVTSALITAVGLRVRVDAAQGFTAQQMLTGRANIGAQEAAAIGNTDRDFAADYIAAKA